MLVLEAKAKAEAIGHQAIANEKLYTREYIQLKAYESLYSKSKLVFGNEIPKNAFVIDKLETLTSEL